MLPKQSNTPSGKLSRNAMKDITKEFRESFPLFSIPREASTDLHLESPRPMLLSRVRFIYQPNDKQIVYPGVYAVVPDAITFAEMQMLDSSLRDSWTSPIRIAKKTIRKFKESVIPKTKSATCNYFTLKNDKLELKEPKVFVTPIDCEYFITDVHKPEYGLSCSVKTASYLLHILLMILQIKRMGVDLLNEDNVNIVRENILLLKSIYPHNRLQVSFKGTEVSLFFGHLVIAEDIFNYDETLIQNYICSFHYLFLNTLYHMGWKKA